MALDFMLDVLKTDASGRVLRIMKRRDEAPWIPSGASHVVEPAFYLGRRARSRPSLANPSISFRHGVIDTYVCDRLEHNGVAS